jgi:shikimate kinase
LIVLIGFMGAGKTTVGQLLAARLGLPFADADAVIEDRAGTPVPDIFAERGEPAFRALEHETIAALLTGPRAVLALGGGAVEHEQTRRLLRAAEEVVYLDISYQGALDRLGHDNSRPMLRRPDLAGVYRRRLSAYQAAATLTVSTEGRPPGHVCAEIMERSNERMAR